MFIAFGRGNQDDRIQALRGEPDPLLKENQKRPGLRPTEGTHVGLWPVLRLRGQERYLRHLGLRLEARQ